MYPRSEYILCTVRSEFRVVYVRNLDVSATRTSSLILSRLRAGAVAWSFRIFCAEGIPECGTCPVAGTLSRPSQGHRAWRGTILHSAGSPLQSPAGSSCVAAHRPALCRVSALGPPALDGEWGSWAPSPSRHDNDCDGHTSWHPRHTSSWHPRNADGGPEVNAAHSSSRHTH